MVLLYPRIRAYYHSFRARSPAATTVSPASPPPASSARHDWRAPGDAGVRGVRGGAPRPGPQRAAAVIDADRHWSELPQPWRRNGTLGRVRGGWGSGVPPRHTIPQVGDWRREVSLDGSLRVIWRVSTPKRQGSRQCSWSAIGEGNGTHVVAQGRGPRSAARSR